MLIDNDLTHIKLFEHLKTKYHTKGYIMSSYKLSCLFVLSLFIACPTIQAERKRGIVRESQELKLAAKIGFYIIAFLVVNGACNNDLYKAPAGVATFANLGVASHALGHFLSVASLRRLGWMAVVASGSIAAAHTKSANGITGWINRHLPDFLACLRPLGANENIRSFALYLPVGHLLEHILESLTPTKKHKYSYDDEE